MSLKDLQFEFRSSLLGTGMVQPISTGAEKGKVTTIWALCRQVPRQEKTWLRVVADLLAFAEESETDLHLCRRYLLKDGRMVFGWHLAVSGSPRRLASSLQGMLAVLARAQPSLDPQQEDVPRGRGALPGVAPFSDGRTEPPELQEAVVPGLARPPSPPAAVQAPPPGFTPTIKVIKNSVDEETGRPFIVEEMPLPHVYQEMNRPNSKGKGAKYLGGGR